MIRWTREYWHVYLYWMNLLTVIQRKPQPDGRDFYKKHPVYVRPYLTGKKGVVIIGSTP